MKQLRKCASLLVTFSLLVSLLTAIPAKAATLGFVDVSSALGDTDAEEGTASGGADEGTGEEEDVMSTLSGETGDSGDTASTGDSGDTASTGDSGDTASTGDSGDTASTGDSGDTASTGDSGDTASTGDSGDTASTGDSGDTVSTGDSGDTASTGDSGDTASTGDSGDTASTGDSGDTADTTGGGSGVSEDEKAADGETPVEEDTASSGTKEDEADGTDVTDNGMSLPFTDVPNNHWSFPYVLYAYEHNLVRGVTETAFNPTGVMTRAAFVTVLYRLSATIEGADMSLAATSFTDIGDINAEFQSAIRWGVAHGIVTGKNPETFAPRENISRQQMCAILVRYLRDYLRYDLSAFAGDTVFADNGAISNYAKEAVSIMQHMDIISGREVDGVTVFDPAGSASRAAVVKVLSIAVQQMPDLQKLPEAEPDTGNSSDTADTGDSGKTDTGDSQKTDTGDSDKKSSSSGGGSSSGGDSGGGGSSSGGGSGGGGSSSGGGSGGGGSSSGGGSGGGGGSSSGGGSTGDNTTPAKEPENAAAVFASINKMVQAYEANPPENDIIKSYMEILMPTWKEMSKARDNGEIVDEAYFKSHYAAELNQLLDKYSATSLTDLMEMMKYAQTLAPMEEFIEVLEYFGLRKILLG